MDISLALSVRRKFFVVSKLNFSLPIDGHSEKYLFIELQMKIKAILKEKILTSIRD